MLKETCVAAVQEAMNIARNKWPHVHFNDLEVDWYSGKKSAGIAYRHFPKVAFNVEFMEQESNESFLQTVIHEVAHYVTWQVYPWAKQAHGPEFKYILRQLGSTRESIKHSYSVKGIGNQMRVFHYGCACGKEYRLSAIMNTKIQRGEVRRCTICSSKISKENFLNKVSLKHG